MNLVNGSCQHIVLFGTFNESKYFLGEFKNKFDTIGFNANIIAHAPEGIAAFVSQLSNKSFFIDPQLHAFQQPQRTIMRKRDDQWVLKSSIEKLAQKYNLYNKESSEVKHIVPGMLSSEEFDSICNNVLDFQLNYIFETSKNLDAYEFLEDLELRPEFLIAPYLYLEPDTFDASLADNIKFIDISKTILTTTVQTNSSNSLFAELVISKEILFDEHNTSKLLKEYGGCVADGFVLWVDDLSENSNKTSERALKAFLNFVTELSKHNKPIINLHGSFLSIILASKAFKLIAAVGHGIEYGEDRPVIPVGGGVPLAKFYFPKFFKRVDYYPDAVTILLMKNWTDRPETFFTNVCTCNMCREIIGQAQNVVEGFKQYGITKISEKNGKAYPDGKAMDKSRRHYLYTKLAEYEFCQKASKSDIIEKLRTNHSVAEEIEEVHPMDHLEKWIRVLTK